MKMRFLGAVFFAALAVAAFADDDIPVYPVHVAITVDPGELTAVVRMQAGYLYDVLGSTFDEPLPGTHWPAATVERAKTYIQNCLTLNLNGRPLSPAAFTPRFIQEPLRPEESQFVFTLRYPTTQTAGPLSGRAAFFSEYKEAEQHEVHPDTDTHNEFITYLTVVGRDTVHFELPLDKPNFELSLDGMARPAFARFWERARRVFLQMMSSPIFWIVLIFIVIQAIKRWKKWKKRISAA